MNLPGNYSGDVIDWISFLLCILVIFNWSTKAKDEDYRPLLNLNAGATLIFISITVLSFFGVSPTFIAEHKVFWSFLSLFGNLNNSAEFLGFSILLQILSLYLFKDKFHLRKALLAYSFVVFFFYLSRSLTLALAASLIFFIPGVLKYPKRVLSSAFIVIVAIATLNVLPYLFKDNKNFDGLRKVSLLTGDYLKSQKQSNIASRYNMLLNTTRMIQDSPYFGFGPTKFQFAYVPYLKSVKQDHIVKENMVARSPHNAFLEATVESGLPFGLLVIIILALAYWHLLKGIKSSKTPMKLFCGASVIFFSIDALFNFPLEIPFPFMSIAIVGGISLSQFNEGMELAFPKWGKALTVMCAVVILGQAMRFYYSHHVLYTSPFDHAKLAFACDLYPRNWKVCIHKAELEIKLKKYKVAHTTIVKELRVNPFNIAGLKALSYIYLNTGKRTEACHLLEMYTSFFKGKTSVTEIKENVCPSNN